MEVQGFTVLDEEWWHFDYVGWRDWGLGNQTFTELARL
jgi:D-alanyl-D-alanine dipeptidase